MLSAREPRPPSMMPGPAGRMVLLLCCLLGGVVGCATFAPSATVVVLLPEPDGTVGSIDVRTDQGTQSLSAAKQATTVATAGARPSAPVTLADQEIADAFGPALAALPSASVRFTLYFLTDSVELTPQSTRLIPHIVAAIRERRSVDTSVVGHTDTVASKAHNDPLSRRRAEAVGNLLEAEGIPPGILDIAAYGKAIPAIPTGDEVAEPRNRRVEVTVR